MVLPVDVAVGAPVSFGKAGVAVSVGTMVSPIDGAVGATAVGGAATFGEVTVTVGISVVFGAVGTIEGAGPTPLGDAVGAMPVGGSAVPFGAVSVAVAFGAGDTTVLFDVGDVAGGAEVTFGERGANGAKGANGAEGASTPTQQSFLTFGLTTPQILTFVHRVDAHFLQRLVSFFPPIFAVLVLFSSMTESSGQILHAH
jgi:hypothetical protein